MMRDTILQVVSGLVGGGGVAALIGWLAQRKKVQADIAQSNIDTAIRLKDEAVSEYHTAEEKLKEARRLLNEVQAELDTAKRYIDMLVAVIEEAELLGRPDVRSLISKVKEWR